MYMQSVGLVKEQAKVVNHLLVKTSGMVNCVKRVELNVQIVPIGCIAN